VVLFLSCRVLCCSCGVFVCVTCLSSYRAPNHSTNTSAPLRPRCARCSHILFTYSVSQSIHRALNYSTNTSAPRRLRCARCSHIPFTPSIILIDSQGAELLDKYMGASEAKVREVFTDHIHTFRFLIYSQGAELLDKYIGASEAKVREVFTHPIHTIPYSQSIHRARSYSTNTSAPPRLRCARCSHALPPARHVSCSSTNSTRSDARVGPTPQA